MKCSKNRDVWNMEHWNIPRGRFSSCFEREGKRNPNNENYQFWQQDESHPIELWSN